MKIKKNMTPEALAANRSNGRKSTGPKTPDGKQRSRHNATTHGFYGSELQISAKDKPDFEELRAMLSKQLKAKTPLQEIARERVIVCAWRCKMALRLESNRSAGQLAGIGVSEAESESARPFPKMPELTQSWTTSPDARRRAIRFLTDLRVDVARNGLRHQDSWSLNVVKGFGWDFLETLIEWAPSMDYDAILLAEHLTQHAKIFKKRLPPLEEPCSAEGVKVIPDPKLQSHMMSKIIDLKIQSINDARIEEFGQQQAMEAVESVHRLFPSCCRDLERAVAWYKSL